MGIKLVATYEDPVSSADLAIYLAEALQGVQNAERDAAAYLSEMQTENQKLIQLTFTLDQVKRYQKNPPPNPSRMDPMLSYDLDAIEDQIQECRNRVQRWTQTREDALNKVVELQTEMARLQTELLERKKRGD